MTPSNLRDYLNQRLSQLSPHLLQTVVEFVEFLLHKQHCPSSTLKLIGQEVEMEALTAVSIAALTLYDMAKGLEKSMTIEQIHLIEKTGGKSGDYRVLT